LKWKPGIADQSSSSRRGRRRFAYVLSGICEVRWGATGEFVARAKAGDFQSMFPAFLLHMEINPSKLEPFRWDCRAQHSDTDCPSTSRTTPGPKPDVPPPGSRDDARKPDVFLQGSPH